MVIRIIHNKIDISLSVVSLPQGNKLKTFDQFIQLNGYKEAI